MSVVIFMKNCCSEFANPTVIGLTPGKVKAVIVGQSSQIVQGVNSKLARIMVSSAPVVGASIKSSLSDNNGSIDLLSNGHRSFSITRFFWCIE